MHSGHAVIGNIFMEIVTLLYHTAPSLTAPFSSLHTLQMDWMQIRMLQCWRISLLHSERDRLYLKIAMLVQMQEVHASRMHDVRLISDAGPHG